MAAERIAMSKTHTRTMESKFRRAGAHIDQLVVRLGAAEEEVQSRLSRDVEGLVADLDQQIEDIDARIALTGTRLERLAAREDGTFLEAARRELDEWKGRIESMQVRSKLARMDLRVEAKESIRRARDLYDAARKDLDERRQARAATVRTLRSRLTDTLDELRNVVDDASKKLA